ncbi:ABC transporter substrate-binding protein [Burkholderia sp. 22PA0106]|uniref:ABC transporter substrate-binding protein n=1 Tax=Burkholderia sp. 22PA0106 TaxID=3237371 RepID=UPI0039C2991E
MPLLSTPRFQSRSLIRLLLRPVLLATALTLSAAVAHAAALDTIRIGVAEQGAGDPPTFGSNPGAVVQQQKLLEKEFAREGIRIQWLFFKGAGPAVNEAIADKSIDFALQGDLPAVLARANGLKTHLIAAVGVRSGIKIGVPTGSDIHTVKDLKGKRVAIFRGTNLQLVIDNVLAANGLDERDLRVINLDTSSALAALASKGIDASVTDYHLSKLVDSGLAKIIYQSQDQGLQFTRQSHLLVLDDFEQAHPDIVQRVVNVFVTAARWASDEGNRDALLNTWAKTGIPVSSWAAEFPAGTLKSRESPLLDPFFVARYTAVAQDALKLKLIRHPADVNGWIEPKYLDQALKAQHLEHYWPSYDASGKPQT